MNGKKARALRRIAKQTNTFKKAVYRDYLSRNSIGRFLFTQIKWSGA